MLEVGADVEIEGDVIVVVLMVCSICAQTCGRSWAAYFQYRAWTPQWLTFFAFSRIHNRSDRLSLRRRATSWYEFSIWRDDLRVVQTNIWEGTGSVPPFAHAVRFVAIVPQSKSKQP